MNQSIGVYFELSEESNSYIDVDQILSFFDYQKFQWKVTCSETHPLLNGQIENGDLFDGIDHISGTELEKLLRHNNYYSIFLSLRGFPLSCIEEDMNKAVITTLEGFINSPCEFYFLIIEGYYMAILLKNSGWLETTYQHVKSLGYINVRFIDKGETWYIE